MSKINPFTINVCNLQASVAKPKISCDHIQKVQVKSIECNCYWVNLCGLSVGSYCNYKQEYELCWKEEYDETENSKKA